MQKVKSSVASTFTFRVVFVGSISVVVVVAALFKSGDIVPFVFLAPLNVIMLWTYFSTWYELRQDSLYICFGPFRKEIKYMDIVDLNMPYAYLNFALMGLSHTCIAIKFRRRTLHTICISPQNQFLFFDALCDSCENLDDN